MTRKLTLLLMALVTLTAFRAIAGNNPHITEVDLDIDGVSDSDEFGTASDPGGPGGFVAKGGWKKITLSYTGTPALRVRLNWSGTKIHVYTDTNATTSISNPKVWDIENNDTLPGELWVKGVDVSDSGPTTTACGPEHMCLEAINNGTDYTTPLYDRVGFTVFEVTNIVVIPKGMTQSEVQEPVSIGAGAMASDAHQADVQIQVNPASADIPLDVKLLNGGCHDSGKEAKLVIDSQTATAGSSAISVTTTNGGLISGVLTSSDVITNCTIHAEQRDRDVQFTWDEFFEAEAWTNTQEYLPFPGTYTNYVVVRHHRIPSACTSNSFTPYKPFAGHDINFFVEQVEYYDTNGTLCVTNNTPDAPHDLSAFAEFQPQSYTADADGRVTSYLQVYTNYDIHSVTMVAYDLSVWTTGIVNSSTSGGGGSGTLSSFGLMPLASPTPSSGSTGDQRQGRPSVDEYDYLERVYPYIAAMPRFVPVVTNTSALIHSTTGGVMYLYLGRDLNGGWNDVNAFTITVTPANKINVVKDTSPHSTTDNRLYDQSGHPDGNKFMRVLFLPHTNIDFTVTITSSANAPNLKGPSSFTFKAVNGSFSWIAGSNPVTFAEASTNFAILPCNNNPQYSVNGRLPDNTLDYKFTSFDLRPLSMVSVTQSSPSTPYQSRKFSATSEGEGQYQGEYLFSSIYTTRITHIIHTDSQGWTQQLYVPTTSSVLRVGTILAAPYMICPKVSIVHPSAACPADGEAGSSPSPMPDSLYVFDNESSYLKKCLAKVEMTNFPNLCQSSRTKVVKQLQWRMPKVGSVSASTYTGAAIPNAPYATNFIYNSMPSNTSAFGNTNVWLEFTQKTNWCWRADAQFRFNRTNNGASSFVNMPNTVSAGNPNWYVYWQQVANQFSNLNSGIFGPQTTKMYYNSATTGTVGESANWQPNQRSPWQDQITMFDSTKNNGILSFVRILHHENGHRQGRQLPPSQGGFGANLAWSRTSDNDFDLINDAWEGAGGVGAALGFSINSTPVVYNNNSNWRYNWDHGWTNIAPGSDCITNSTQSFVPYTNPNGYNQSTGSGLCPRNESHVDAQAGLIPLWDWSFQTP